MGHKDDDLKLCNELRKVGWIKRIFGLEFYFSVVISVVLFIIMCYYGTSDTMESVFIGGSMAGLGFLVAANALILTTNNNREFMKKLFKSDFFTEIRLDFSVTSIIIVINIVLSIVYSIISSELNHLCNVLLYSLCIFTFLYVATGIAMLITNSFRMLGKIISEYEEKKENGKENN